MSFPDLLKIPKIDKLGVQELVNRFCKRSIKTSAKKHGLHLALSMIDLTTLEGKDTTDKVRRLCYKASHLHNSLQGLPNVAAVCVYPTLVRVAKKELEGTKINVASVATAFPSGQSTLDVKLSDTKFAVNEGADEVDMVISRGKFLAGEYNFVYDEIAAVKEACGKAHLKVILETGELDTLDNVRKASDIAIYAGADFIKTSTGKIQPAATERAVLIMLDAIKEYYDKTGKKIGIKAAGGIADKSQVFRYYCLVKSVLGDEWLTKDLFRIGASRLAGHIIEQF